jgi:hopanoid biosynthesis associated radical SAM protein HpnH
LHQRAAAQEEDRRLQAVALLHLVDPPRWRQADARHAVDQPGTYEVALEAIELAKSKGFRVQVNCTVFDGADPDRLAAFFDEMKSRDVEITVSPGYAYERAADQEHFLNRERTKQFFRDVFSRGNKGKNWAFTNSPLFLDFLAGNQTYECTPWSMPLRTVFGWQKPCYLLGEGYVESFRELMEGTDWEKYGVGKYEKCANCMTHCGFEGTAATDAIRHPLKMMQVARKGVKTDGPMAPESICRRRAPPTTSIQATSSANSPRSRPKIPLRPSAW